MSNRRDETELFSHVEGFISVLAQCQALGIKVVSARENELILELPYTEQIIGNPDNGVIHGGAITTLMDTCAGAGVLCAMPDFELCPTLDLRVDYMRSAKPGQPVYARATCYRRTSNILFMRCEAYQIDRSVAHCVATFMRMGEKGVKSLSQMTNGVNIAPYQALPKVEGNFKEVVKQVRENQRYDDLAQIIPYAQHIGVSFAKVEGDLLFKLPQKASNIGNPKLPAIHGGVLGGFMELSSALYLLVSQSTLKYPKIIDFSLDYLRAGMNQDTYAYCQVTRQGGRVANVEVHAWQTDRTTPIALARAHFLLED